MLAKGVAQQELCAPVPTPAAGILNSQHLSVMCKIPVDNTNYRHSSHKFVPIYKLNANFFIINSSELETIFCYVIVKCFLFVLSNYFEGKLLMGFLLSLFQCVNYF